MLTIPNRVRAARRSSAVFATLIMLAACDAAYPTESSTHHRPTPMSTRPSTQTSGAERLVYETLHDVEGSEVSVECGDGTVSEPITLTGKIFDRFAAVLDPAGGEHTVYHAMPVGLTGVGSVSGEEFRVKVLDHGVSRLTTRVVGGSYRQTLWFVGRTSGRSFGLVLSGKYAISANGEVVVSREKVVAECEG